MKNSRRGRKASICHAENRLMGAKKANKEELKQRMCILMTKPDEDEANAAWMQRVAREWHDELADERQDLYTLDDGEPVDVAASPVTAPPDNL